MNTSVQWFEENLSSIFSDASVRDQMRYAKLLRTALKLRKIKNHPYFEVITAALYEFSHCSQRSDYMPVLEIQNTAYLFDGLLDEEASSIDAILENFFPGEIRTIRDFFAKKFEAPVINLYNAPEEDLSEEERIYEAMREASNVDNFDDFKILKSGLKIGEIFDAFEEYFAFEPLHPLTGIERKERYGQMIVRRGKERILITATPGQSESYISIVK